MTSIKPLISKYLYKIKQKASPTPKVMSLEKTMNKIIKDRCSVSRFGDGEFKWIYGLKQDSFQDFNQKLQNDLISVMKEPKENCIICISPIFNGLDMFTDEAAFFWEKHYIRYSRKWLKLLNNTQIYYDANITRPYMEYADKRLSKKIFLDWKKVFRNRNILIVEGEYTRFGVGNSFLENAKSVHRIVCPNKNAFKKIDYIEQAILNYSKEIRDPLVLVALGPTATVISSDLCSDNLQLIDIGHADIEYEWYLRKAQSKISIKDKFVNEAGDNLKDFGRISDGHYNSQIVQIIK